MTYSTHYDTLGLPPDATPAEIQEAFVRLSAPGTLACSTPPVDLREAYETLADPRRRAEYDWRLGIDDLQPRVWSEPVPERSTT